METNLLDSVNGVVTWLNKHWGEARGALFRLVIPLERERLQPCFSGSWVDVSEVVGELGSSAFQLFKDAFDGIPISMCSFHTELGSRDGAAPLATMAHHRPERQRR